MCYNGIVKSLHRCRTLRLAPLLFIGGGENVAGKPKYQSPEEMQEQIDAYFASLEGELLCDGGGNPVYDKFGKPCFLKPPRPPTVTGLALYLGFASRQALINYSTRSKGFNDTITRAKSRIEEYAETRLYDREGQRGAEFNLRVNFGWREQKDADADRDALERLDRILRNIKIGGE